MASHLKDRVVVITGAGSGFGRILSIEATARGAKVVGSDVNAAALRETSALAGGITTVIAAITAAICTSKEAHEDPDKRYVAGVANGVFYLVGGLLAGTIVALFTSLPNAFVAVLAGLALMGAISSNISAFAAEKSHLEASVLTFVATASGVSFLGLGSAFWGVVVGGLAYNLLHRRFAPLNNDTQ